MCMNQDSQNTFYSDPVVFVHFQGWIRLEIELVVRDRGRDVEMTDGDPKST